MRLLVQSFCVIELVLVRLDTVKDYIYNFFSLIQIIRNKIIQNLRISLEKGSLNEL